MSPLTHIVIAAVTAGLPTLTVLVSLLINNQRLTDLGNRMSDFEKRVDRKFDDQRGLLRSEFLRVEQVMDARLKHLEESFGR